MDVAHEKPTATCEPDPIVHANCIILGRSQRTNPVGSGSDHVDKHNNEHNNDNPRRALSMRHCQQHTTSLVSQVTLSILSAISKSKM